MGSNPEYSTVGAIYKFTPLPPGLPAQYDTNILGAQCTLFTEYVPSAENVMFKVFPRACAMAELDWTPATSMNYTNFLARLAVYEQRLSQMVANYNRESIPQAVARGRLQQVPASYSTLQWDITTQRCRRWGEIDVNFCYTNGVNGLNIAWTALVENGTEI